MNRPNELFIEEFLWTWPAHKGHVSAAALVLDMKPSGVLRALERAKKRGVKVPYVNDECWSYETDQRYWEKRFAHAVSA